MTVLIQGESGVGKELGAQELHRHSERADGNFVALDCCTLQENLFESELFGHERGAFTGADRMKRGLIEGAENGTLFLDEIGDIDPSIQAKLLRVLESGQFRRLGGTKDLKANVRIVTATNRRLDELTGDGRFRSGLYYRLSAFVIDVPPLRDRREDIAELVGHFIRNTDISHRNKKGASARVLKQLVEYDWPGNVRELKNVVERAIILAGDDSEIRPQHLTFAPGRSGNSSDVPFCEVGWVSHRSKVGSSFPVCCRAVRQSVRVYASGTC
jgi:transcriptional regulator with PAS, ATPase and Fis domain